MAPSFEHDVSNLLCREDSDNIMDSNHDAVEEVEGQRNELEHCQNNGSLGDFSIESSVMNEEFLVEMLGKECLHLPGEIYKKKLKTGVLDSSVRKFVVDWIGKVHTHFNFGPLTAYRSISYFDRFISASVLPNGITWITQLLAIACLSLAAKIEENEVPPYRELQACTGRCLFEPKSIKRMELLVLCTLEWRMQTVTPFSYVEYFLQKINDDKPPPKTSIHRSVEVILRTIRGIEFLEFRPSEIAAAAAIAVMGEPQTLDFNKAASFCYHVDKVRVFMCYEQIQELRLVSNSVDFKAAGGPPSSLPSSPIGVLDASCWSSNRGDQRPSWSQANPHRSPLPAAKRLKFENMSDDKQE